MMMASAALGDELSCSICLSLYTEPVSLRCGHNFCRSCMVAALDTQEGSGVYSCPECREEYTERPSLEKNRKLCNIVENFRSTQQMHIDLINNIKSKNHFNIQVETDLILDEKTANYFVVLSEDLKTATATETRLSRPELPERFKRWSQVMSVQSFPSGRHYWEVEVSVSGEWEVGVSYNSVDRTGDDSSFGGDNKSWSFRMSGNEWNGVEYSFWHNKNGQVLQLNTLVQKLGVYLDYEDGRLSFYQLCDPIRHLHTFTATFTEPLHAAFYVNCDAWIKIRRDVCGVLYDT